MIKIADVLVHDFSERIGGTSDENTREDAAFLLLKKPSELPILKDLFRDQGASLIQNVELERCSRRTEFDEDRFVQFYPYLPHLIDLSMEISACSRSRPIAEQCFEMLTSDRTRLISQPVGVLVSIDNIYEVIDREIPPEKQTDIIEICQRFDNDKDYPGMAGRVAKALCVMEFVKTDLPRTARNIAALLVRRVTEAPHLTAVTAILERMRQARFARENEDGWKLYDFAELRRAAGSLEERKNRIGIVNPRLPGWRNELIQVGKKLLARALTWYSRPVYEFNTHVTRTIEEMVWTLDHLATNQISTDEVSKQIVGPMDMVALEARLTRVEKRIAALATSMQNSQIPIDVGLEQDRTTYLIGLFGTGRHYVNDLILENIGGRARYLRDTIRVHPGPTPMIYTGHATLKYVSRLQYRPHVTTRILESVRSGFADLIFIYRHPLDSLLTNWVWWRTYIRDSRSISGISQIYKNTDDLCADLERDFGGFESFATADPEFFAGTPGPCFLSFREFVEETELHSQSASLALRLEDFMIDPAREFSRITEVMSVDLDVSGLPLAPPKSKPYGHVAVKDKVPRFRNFIESLDAETKQRIEKLGYGEGGFS